MGIEGCLPLVATGPVGRWSIYRWLQYGRPRLVCSTAPGGMVPSRRRRRALKDYVANKEETSLIRDDIRIGLRSVITLLGKLGLGRPRDQALLYWCRKCHYLHLLLPTMRELTNI